jgi:predicted O-methyltransferase YrrM
VTDVERFERELPGLFDDFPGSKEPRDPRFAEILAAVPGLAKANNLALVNLAAACLGAGECYVEAGTYHGTSLIAAMLDNENEQFIAIDNFAMSGGSREQLDANLDRFELTGKAMVLEEDIFDVLHGDALVGMRIGVFYWDLLHKYEPQLDGLRLLERHLADGALVIVDDTDWTQVARAIDDFVAGEPRAHRVLALPGNDKGSPQWWEGVEVLRLGG